MRASGFDLALGKYIIWKIKAVQKLSKCSHMMTANVLSGVDNVQVVEFVVILIPADAQSLEVIHLE